MYLSLKNDRMISFDTNQYIFNLVVLVTSPTFHCIFCKLIKQYAVKNLKIFRPKHSIHL